MEFRYKNKGVCSRETVIDLNEDHTINSISIVGGCDGNLRGIEALLKGEKAENAIARLQGIKCGIKSTSCPDQVAIALTDALKQIEK